MNSFISLLFYLFNDILVSGLTKSSLEILFFNIYNKNINTNNTFLIKYDEKYINKNVI